MTSGAALSLSHPIRAGMASVPGLPEIQVSPARSLSAGDPLTITSVSLHSHAGTHIDAPSHAIPGGHTIDQIPLRRFMGPCVVSCVSPVAGRAVSVQDILDGGPQPARGDMLLISTGWGAKFESATYYDHPNLDEEVADWAVDLGLNLLGVDMLTPEVPSSRRDENFDYYIHRTLLGSGVLIAENLRLLEVGPMRGMVTAVPVMAAGCDAGWAQFILTTS